MEARDLIFDERRRIVAGIVGISGDGRQEQVARMLETIGHRGDAGSKILESQGVTLGAVWPEAQVVPTSPTLQKQAAWDGNRPPLPDPSALAQKREPFALAVATSDGVFLARDSLGVSPLYYGRTDDGALCFASEVKALLEVTQDVHEFPPGVCYDDQDGFKTFSEVDRQPALKRDAGQIASGLRLRLEQSVCRRIDGPVMGCWLSGGLDSSAMVALARPHVSKLHTFAAGLPGAPDLAFARQVADFLDTEHHEVLVTLDDLLAVLPDVIYHLESFDSLLVRSTLINYLVTRYAADYVGSVFSGEGADELFGGYAYLKELEPDRLPDELLDLIRRLHNLALQRVDRSASAHGLAVRIPYLDLDVADYAMRIPPQFKVWRKDEVVEKWILRQALADALPDEVLWRPKAKFWQGAGVGEVMAQYAEARISDEEFKSERTLPNGWTLISKEELMYYRTFREHFGELSDLTWMGRCTSNLLGS
jgi:asparagine synthase (glutamine-hydrolysing)